MVTALGLNEEIRYLLVNGCVGEPAASQYLAYRENQDLPDPESIIGDPRVTLNARPDQLWLINGSLIRALQANFSLERWDSVGEFIKRLFEEQNPDMATALYQNWLQISPQGATVDRAIVKQLAPFLEHLR
jgi:hypothetical protein